MVAGVACGTTGEGGETDMTGLSVETGRGTQRGDCGQRAGRVGEMPEAGRTGDALGSWALGSGTAQTGVIRVRSEADGGWSRRNVNPAVGCGRDGRDEGGLRSRHQQAASNGAVRGPGLQTGGARQRGTAPGTWSAPPAGSQTKVPA